MIFLTIELWELLQHLRPETGMVTSNDKTINGSDDE